MEKFSKILTNSLASILAILFVVTTVMAFALYSVERSAFDPELYKQVMNEEQVYQRLPDLIAQTLSTTAQQPDGSGILSLFRNLSMQEWKVLIDQLLPPDQLRSLAEDAVTQIMAYLNGESEKAVLSFAGLKTHLTSQEGIDAFYAMLKAQPDCTVEQLTAMATGQSSITLCNPPDTFLIFDLRPVIESQIKATLSLVPDQVTLISPSNTNPQSLRDLKNIRTVMHLSPLVPMLCLLLITALAIRSFRDWLLWWGYPFLLAGLISMSLSLISGPMAAWFFTFVVSPRLPASLPAGMVNVLSDLMGSIVHTALLPVVKLAGIMALVGFVMVVLTILFRGRSRRQPGTIRN